MHIEGVEIFFALIRKETSVFGEGMKNLGFSRQIWWNEADDSHAR